MLNPLPANVVTGLIVLVAISIIVLLLIPALVTFQRFLRKATFEEMEQYKSESSHESIVGSCIGLVLIDCLLYVAQGPVLPRGFFYPAVGGVNLIVFSFVAYHLLNRLLIRIRTRILLKQR
jgi:hypothetical protein